MVADDNTTVMHKTIQTIMVFGKRIIAIYYDWKEICTITNDAYYEGCECKSVAITCIYQA